MSCKCPHCAAELPPETVAAIVSTYTSITITQCAGIHADGSRCTRMLQARQRIRPCPDCGHNNWRQARELRKGAGRG